MKKHLLLLTSAVIAFTACRRDVEPGERDTEISFKTEITTPTRVTDNLFEAGDNIVVTATDEDGKDFVANVSYSFASDLFTSSSPITKDDQSTKLQFTAIYPATSTLENEFSFTVYENQNSGDNFELSDLLVAVTGLTSETTPTLTFDHKLTNIAVNFKFSDGEVMTPEDAVIYALTTTVCDIEADSFIASEDDFAAITPKMTSESTCAAIIAPQTVLDTEAFIQATYNGTLYTYSFAANTVLESGYMYEYDFIVDAETGEVTIDLINATIDDWTEGEL
ncbi:MAG: fimbrillin family protein [Rikenellaceae bacterium]